MGTASVLRTDRGRDKTNSRRELVTVEFVKDTDRPLHVYSAASGELIAKLKEGTDIDHFLSMLSDEAFN